MDPIRKRFADVAFPCHLIGYGAERNYRTRFRGENAGWFGERHCETLEDAVQWVAGCGFEGTLGEMQFFACYGEVRDV